VGTLTESRGQALYGLVTVQKQVSFPLFGVAELVSDFLRNELPSGAQVLETLRSPLIRKVYSLLLRAKADLIATMNSLQEEDDDELHTLETDHFTQSRKRRGRGQKSDWEIRRDQLDCKNELLEALFQCLLKNEFSLDECKCAGVASACQVGSATSASADTRRRLIKTCFEGYLKDMFELWGYEVVGVCRGWKVWYKPPPPVPMEFHPDNQIEMD
jgi:hypothetical protein